MKRPAKPARRPKVMRAPVQVPQLRGTAEWGTFLDKLMLAVIKAGIEIPKSRSALAEYALSELGTVHGLTGPKRAKPVGANRYYKPEG